jgi:serine/threonine protein kinase
VTLYLVSNAEDPDGRLEVLSEDGEQVFGRTCCIDVDGVAHSVLAVCVKSEDTRSASIERLLHEHRLKDLLESTWAARPLELVRDRGRTMLLLEDLGGEPLLRYLGDPMDITRFLRLAMSIATALGKVHQSGLIHKNLKPANILVNGTNDAVHLTGFGIASQLARERQSPNLPEIITGTLIYMAPEQTGRMNRSVDSRSDLYALGVIFYEMLTGVSPFSADDPLEWAHCHLAGRPMAPAERLNDCPGSVSTIVMKLLAKRAEDRYQTTAGLTHDLRRCLAEWEAKHCIGNFPLGEHDTPDRLLIHEKLYGREREVEALLAAFHRVVATGAPESVLV